MSNNLQISWWKDNRGALFGMDARIAVIAFAAMTMGIGYYSIGKISSARTAAFIGELENMKSALNELRVDMGTLPRDALLAESNGLIDFEALYIKDRIKPRLQSYWNGPYYATRMSRKHPQFGNYSITYGNADRNDCNSFKDPCYAWITLSEVPEDQWQNVNDYFDGFDEPNPERQGLVMSDSLSDIRTLYFRTISDKRR